MKSGLLEHISAISKRYELNSINRQATQLRQSAISDEYVDVIVLGQFKAGKSSMINSFLEKPVLPVGVLPVTAIVTRLTGGEKLVARVSNNDGTQEQVPIENIDRFISENKNPGNVKGVSLIDITLPSLKKYPNIRFIDTPGLGSIFRHNTQTTRQWFEKIGAAVVVISATQPLSENDIDLIKTAVEHSPEINLVISKTDLLSKNESNQIVDFVNERINEVFGKQFPVFLYSTLKNTRALQQTIIKKVVRPLSGNALRTNAGIFNHKLIRLSRLLFNDLQLKLEIAKKAENEREKLEERIIDEQLKMDYLRNEINMIAEHYQSLTRKKLENRILEVHKNTLTEKLASDFDSAFESWKGNLYRLARKYEKWIKENIAAGVKRVEESEKEFIQEHVNDCNKHFEHYLDGFREKLNTKLISVLGKGLPKEEINLTVPLMKKADTSVSWAFESQIDLLWFLIPVSIFRQKIHGYFRKQIPREVEINLHRFVSIETNRINKTIDQQQKKVLEYLETELSNIREVLTMNKIKPEEISADIQSTHDLIDGFGKENQQKKQLQK